MRQKLSSIAQSLRMPSVCILCKQFHKNSMAVCTDCMTFVKPLGSACQQCAYPLPDDGYLICGYCIKKPPHFDRAIIAYRFEEPLRGILHQFKYHNGLYLNSFLSQLILNAAQQLKTSIPQCLIPVPMHPQRLKIRGFNQAALLAKTLARKLNRPCNLTACEKRINTAPQASLDGEHRQKNLQNAFHVTAIPYEHIALIDDLLTTGSTANELALNLKKMGVKQVDIWCCARAVIKNN